MHLIDALFNLFKQTLQEKTQSQKAAETIEASTQQEKRRRDTKVKRQTPNVMPEVEKVVEEFVKYTTETAGVDGLRKECRIVLDFKPEPGTYSKFEASPHLNRYPEIPCLDETRVVLQPSEGCDNDYIHANKVKMDKLDREFILTQGPKSNTVEDFWRMVFQIDHLDQYDVYTLEVLPDGCSNSMLTKLAHCTTWPGKPGPVTLLCSAGIGRTGTLVAIDAVCNRLFKGFEGKVRK
uniref:Protein-tyrosine phosphatase n=1 Tax=Angiostrongylus cantonensis TaxID=6313 RepID=A0A0K0D3V6_ANGCA